MAGSWMDSLPLGAKVIENSGGTKYDEEKPDFSLIDAEWLEEVAKVMTFGKKKYAIYGDCTCHVNNVKELLKYKPKDFVRDVITKGSWQQIQPSLRSNDQMLAHGTPRIKKNYDYINNNGIWLTLKLLNGANELPLNENTKSQIKNLMLFLDTTAVLSAVVPNNSVSITIITPEQFENDCVRHVTLLWGLLNDDNGWKKHNTTCPSLNEVTSGANNWRKGIALTRVLSAGLRHLWAVVRGEDNDPETGLSHLAHLSCCSMFAFWYLKHRSDLDDRYKQFPDFLSSTTRTTYRSRMGLEQSVVPNLYGCDSNNNSNVITRKL